MNIEGIRVLVVGGEGREDALVYLISRSPLVSQVFCAPGNDNIAQWSKTRCLPFLRASNKMADILALRNFAKENRIGLTVVGPEKPLIVGIVDRFEKVGLKIVGPNRAAARLEGSKVFAKKFMERYKIPTAGFMLFNDPEKARKYAMVNLPCVIKPDGLTAGKGVVLCHNEEDVAVAIKRIMIDKEEFKESGNWVVVEEFLTGEEATFMVLTDGWNIIPLLPTQDHKAVFDGDQGPNTGGMGAYAPVPAVTKELEERIIREIVEPTLRCMRSQGRIYRGILYVGLMITSDGPKVLEFNCRFGDPELQPLVLLMESDIVPIFMEIAEGKLTTKEIKWSEGSAICVEMCSRGYPGTPEIGRVIKGLNEVAKMEDVVVFHAGTVKKNGIWRTAGGRVLGVTAEANDIFKAKDLVYEAVSMIRWKEEHHRTDIGWRALQHGLQVKMTI